jgi:hypothetical protein
VPVDVKGDVRLVSVPFAISIAGGECRHAIFLRIEDMRDGERVEGERRILSIKPMEA